jgi:hypothetical protein
LRECDACRHLSLYLLIHICSVELGFNNLRFMAPISKIVAQRLKPHLVSAFGAAKAAP